MLLLLVGGMNLDGLNVIYLLNFFLTWVLRKDPRCWHIEVAVNSLALHVGAEGLPIHPIKS